LLLRRAVALALVVAAAAQGRSLCSAPGWQVTFEDEFEGDALDSKVWSVKSNGTHGPTEQELYTADEVWVEGGALVLRTRKREALGPQGQRYNFTSGWVDSMGKRFQRYGRFEVRALLPSANAGRPSKWPDAWPAHWLMPEPSTSHPPNICWPMGGEIDIMEAFRPRGDGPLSQSVIMTYHWAEECGKDLWGREQGFFPLLDDARPQIDWSNDWHTYGVEWTEESVIWYVDGQPRYVRRRGEPASLFVASDPMYLILNTALNPWARAAVDEDFPVYHVIDRVTWCEPSQQ